jgi:hypothetical protein
VQHRVDAVRGLFLFGVDGLYLAIVDALDPVKVVD